MKANTRLAQADAVIAHASVNLKGLCWLGIPPLVNVKQLERWRAQARKRHAARTKERSRG